MKRIFRPIDFNRPDRLFEAVVDVFILSAAMGVIIVFFLFLWAIYYPPKFHKASYAPYYSVEEYKRLEKTKDYYLVVVEESGQAPDNIFTRARIWDASASDFPD